MPKKVSGRYGDRASAYIVHYPYDFTSQYPQVFLKYYHIEQLSRKFEEQQRAITMAQSAVRMWIQRKRFRQRRKFVRQSAITIQRRKCLITFTTECTGRVGLAHRYHARLRGERSGFGAWPQQPEMTLRIIEQKQQKSTLTLKLMGRVIRSQKQGVPVAPQNGPRSNKDLKIKQNVMLLTLFVLIYSHEANANSDNLILLSLIFTADVRGYLVRRKYRFELHGRRMAVVTVQRGKHR